jgi:hypothetical protein
VGGCSRHSVAGQITPWSALLKELGEEAVQAAVVTYQQELATLREEADTKVPAEPVKKREMKQKFPPQLQELVLKIDRRAGESGKRLEWYIR